MIHEKRFSKIRTIVYNNVNSGEKMIDFTEEDYKQKIDEWERDEYKNPEELLSGLFEDGRVSDNEEKELLRISILNQVYSTYLYTSELVNISKYLSENHSQLNELLSNGSERAVALISRAMKRDDSRGRLCYVFATKYCNFITRKSDAYPIFDNSVGKIYIENRCLWDYVDEVLVEDSVFKRPESNASEEEIISQYKSYKIAVNQLKNNFVWIDSKKKLDQYLWMSTKIIKDDLENKCKSESDPQSAYSAPSGS